MKNSVLAMILSVFVLSTSPVSSVSAKQKKDVQKTLRTKISKPDLALRLFAAAKNRWTLHKIIGKRLSKIDKDF